MDSELAEVGAVGRGAEEGPLDSLENGNSLDLPSKDSLPPLLPPHSVIIKWAGKEIEIEDINSLKTVRDLKSSIQQKTGVQLQRQKLLNLTFKGKVAQEDCLLTNLNLKPGHKIMMMGSLEKDIENVDIPPEERPDVNNDLDVADDFEFREHCDAVSVKLGKRRTDYHVNILNEPRTGKKLLVLDIDYTLFDHRSVAETGTELMRPFLHEFLTAAYRDYDIVIWSATSMKWIEEKMKLLGVHNHPDYKIAFYLDYLAMISIHTQKYGLVDVKPLRVIWDKFEMYTHKNTIMIDDLRRNFLLNPQNGLKIRPFRSAHLNRATDRELLRIGVYLKKIADQKDLRGLNHRHWEQYTSKSQDSRARKSSSSRRRRRDDDNPEQS